MSWLFSILTALYIIAAGLLMLYGLNCYILIFLFRRSRSKTLARYRNAELRHSISEAGRPDDVSIPRVTTQIAVYNEMNVAERVIRAAVAMRYPAGYHEIQVLDDSTDDTCRIIDAVAGELTEDLKSAGVALRIIRRNHRTGYKAGALKQGLETATGELIAIFDADFVPPPDFLERTVPHLLADEKVGLVQARWGHLNRRRSLLTRAQGMGIDGHFMVEQAARDFNHLYMNFNGTAGIWRKQAILDGGNWQSDTLTEDMDLSYRVQFAGWRTRFLPDLVVPAELPEDIRAFKQQQFRWAKGSIQTAVKLFPRLMAQPVSVFQKAQAIFHMTHYIVHPLMLFLAITALPVLLSSRFFLPAPLLVFFLTALLFSMTAPSALYLTAQRATYRDWKRRMPAVPILMMAGTGIALSNTRAVFEALFGGVGEFIRTPKRGEREQQRYGLRPDWPALVEILIGCWCAATLGICLGTDRIFITPFMLVYAAGFLFVGLLSALHSLGWDV